MREGRLSFSTDTPESVRNALAAFIAVPTPSRPDGGTDLTAVEAVARELDLPLTKIGQMAVGRGLRVRDPVGREMALEGTGWRHF